MKSRNVALVGFSALFVGLLLSFYLQIAMFLLGLAICFAIAPGFLWQGHKVRVFQIPTGNGHETDPPTITTIRIEGREFAIQNLPPRLAFILSCRNISLLAGIGLVALGTMIVVLTGIVPAFVMSDPNTERHWLYYVLCYFLFILLLPCLTWISECALIRHAGITLANVHGQGRGAIIAYDFRGPHGGYHGGSAINFGGPKDDNLKVVFCNPANPDTNRVSAGMLFHKVMWVDLQS